MGADKLDISRLHMTTASFGLQDGLLEHIHNFLAAYPGIGLIIVDTLEHIRNTETAGSMYTCDYRDMIRLREITDKHRLTLYNYAYVNMLGKKRARNIKTSVG